MSIGWFSIGRENGAPSWYGGDQQTPVVLDLQIAALLSVFITPTLAFLIVLPGIRRLRAISSLTFLFSMVVGASIMLSIHYPCWHTGEVRIYTTYKAFTSERLNALLGVRVGLRHVNITFSSKVDAYAFQTVEQIVLRTNSVSAIGTEVIVSPTPPPELDYNERFDFNDVSSMELDRTLEKGLPYPILKVIEFLSVDRTGFLWGKQYRVAGYYTFCLLWFAFTCWLLQMMVLCVVPHHFCKCMLTVGLVTILADLTYALNVPQHLIIRFPGPYDSQSALQFSFSTCFYATSIAAGHGKQSTASSILEDGTAYPFCEDLCMTASSREGSIKSNDGRTNSSSPSWFALPRFKNRPWSGYSTEDVATKSRASTSNAHSTQKALDCEAQTASCESSSSSSGNSSGDE